MMKASLLLFFITVVLLPQTGMAEESPGVLASSLKDLYVFHAPKSKDEPQPEWLQVVLTLNSYQGTLLFADVVESAHKYVIYVSDSDFKVLRTFEFYFGGPSQFAVNVSGESETAVGKVGEYVKHDWFSAYAGLRGDPAFYDKEGFRDFIDRACLPESGFRCADSGEVINYFQNKNVIALALNLKIAAINPAGPEQGNTKFHVWAKAFKPKE